jgi:hypothetical protein
MKPSKHFVVRIKVEGDKCQVANGEKITAVYVVIRKKLECVPLPCTSTLVYYLQARMETTSVEPLMGLYSNVSLLALHSKIRIVRKLMELANAPVYYDMATMEELVLDTNAGKQPS